MTLEIRVNGATLDTAGATAERVLAEMKRQGWIVNSIECDGRPLDEHSLSGVESGVVELAASQPSDSDASAAPRPALLERLRGSMPAFRDEAEQLGLAFGRGEWRQSLERLTRYLGEIELADAGFRALSDLDPDGDRQIDRIPPMLRELSQAIRDQSWVEVSDVLLYEVAPLFGDWAQSDSPA